MDNSEVITIPKNFAMLMLNIIVVCSKRGSFNPEEFKPIGELFEYLKKEVKIEETQTQTEKQTETQTETQTEIQ